MNKVAVTGCLSSGKSTVCSILKMLGAYVVSADEIVHKVLSPKTSVGQQVIAYFGDAILTDDSIDRQKLSDTVFSDRDKLKKLEDLIHPIVFEEIEKHYQKVKKDRNFSLFVAEIPLLYESKSKTHFDTVISVVASNEVCRKRFNQETSHHTTHEFDKRMARQMATEEKAIYSDYVLVNDGSLEDLKKQVEILFSNLV